MSPLPITFLSDFGLEDEFVGVCHAVISRIVPEACVTDLSHGIRRHDIDHGATVLARTLPYAAPGVHLAVVDPGVGTGRRGVAVRTAEQGRLLVGPDNGLLIAAAQRFGGVAEAADISCSPFGADRASASFHGRDLFAPVTGVLAQGARLEEVGERLEAHELVGREPTEPSARNGTTAARVEGIDRFGNLSLDVGRGLITRTGLRLGYPLVIELAGERRVEAVFANTFGGVAAGDLLAYIDSWGSLSIAVNRGDAARALGLAIGDQVRLSGAEAPSARQPA
ncbi:MAG: SAM-dependent chlorinase/fluorinase [Solirubrobacterales bacterium]|nr:SAM-dependent chlorinase/fluorinase [Solirubrobacterales bacterium]